MFRSVTLAGRADVVASRQATAPAVLPDGDGTLRQSRDVDGMRLAASKRAPDSVRVSMTTGDPREPAATDSEVSVATTTTALRRSGLAAAAYAAAAWVAYRGGYAGQAGPYLAMAAAMLPQVALLWLARADAERRSRLRAGRGLMPLHACISGALTVVGFAEVFLHGWSYVPAWAALVAAAAAGLAAVPPVVAPARTASPRRRTPLRRAPQVRSPS